MNKKSHYYIVVYSVLGMLFFQHFHLYAQDTKKVSLDLKEATFGELAKNIEEQTDYIFYYNALQMDTLLVTITVTNQPVRDVLNQVLAKSSFNYSIDKEQHIFVTYGRIIQTSLPLDFFQKVEVKNKEAEVVVDYFEGQRREVDTKQKVYDIGIKSNTIKKGNATITGRVIDIETGEPIAGAAIFIREPLIGASADPLGYYSLTLPKGRHTLVINSLGMQETERSIILYSNGSLDIELQENVQSLKEVLVTAEREDNIVNPQIGIEKMDIKTIKRIPTAMGESDVLRVILTLPGVSSVGEASTGFNVRGGTVDQNLIQLNEATIYNPSHLFGFFSSFNPDVLKDVQLYKSSIPAKFGGRLSSVLDITTREGNKKKLSGSGGIGLITSRLSIEGPLGSEKTSFILGGRSNYSNWLLRNLEDPDFRASSASFYDINFGIAHQFNKKNNLTVNAYLSRDRFQFRNDTTYAYNNLAVSIKWKNLISDKLFNETSVAYSRYNFDVNADRNPVNAYNLGFIIEETNFKSGLNFFPSKDYAFEAGINGKYYQLSPGSLRPEGTASLVEENIIDSESALETALYLSGEFDFSNKISVNAGLRYVMFNHFGPSEVVSYAEGVPRTESSIVSTTNFDRGEIVKTYHGPEVRAAFRYALNSQSSIKLSYNMQRQFIHMLSNTAAIAPTNIWKLSDTHIKPQFGQQLSLGLYKNFQRGLIETSLEAYYKTVNNFLDFKSGATLIMNSLIETDVINTRSKAYGVEFLIKKTKGKLNGWLSYTYSRSLLQQDDDIAGELINQGEWYPSNFDKPHDVTLVGNYKFSHRVSLSLNFTYSTGRPITLPISTFNYGGSDRVLYSDRNEFRIPDYYRTDISINLEGNHKVRKLAHSSWTLAVYNLTGRKNPYSIFFISENGNVQGYRLSIFGRPIPTVTYNFKF